MLTVFWDFAIAATVMALWVLAAFALAFVGYFLTDLIGDRIYGRQTNKGRGRQWQRR